MKYSFSNAYINNQNNKMWNAKQKVDAELQIKLEVINVMLSLDQKNFGWEYFLESFLLKDGKISFLNPFRNKGNMWKRTLCGFFVIYKR